MPALWVENQGGKIAYEVAGEGPLVICTPGMGDLRQGFRFLAPQLVQAGYRVAAMDVRGHGESSTQWADFSVAGVGSDMLALVQALGGGPAVLIGNSMAAGAAVWAAAEAPAQVRGVVLVGPFVDGSGSGMQKLLFSALFARPWGPAVWQRYYASLYPTRKPDDFQSYSARLRANLSEAGRLEALQAMMQASKAASAERLPDVQAPALVVMGSKDPDFKDPAAEAARVAARVRGACRMIDGAGHYPHTEMPEIAGPVMIDFLNGLR